MKYILSIFLSIIFFNFYSQKIEIQSNGNTYSIYLKKDKINLTVNGCEIKKKNILKKCHSFFDAIKSVNYDESKCIKKIYPNKLIEATIFIESRNENQKIDNQCIYEKGSYQELVLSINNYLEKKVINTKCRKIKNCVNK